MIASAGSKSNDKAKAMEVQKVVEDSTFWNHIKRYITNSELSASLLKGY